MTERTKDSRGRVRPAIVLLALVVSGCAEFRAPTSWLDRDVPRATARNPVERIVAIWQPAEGRGLNGLPGRGFAGQILFFPSGGDTPVAVDGDVRVYVFDDQGPSEEQVKPIHQFDFVDGGWEAQLVEGSLGPSYQLFLPYTRKGSHRAKCSLRIRLQPKVGPAVYSDVINVVLPGQKNEEPLPELVAEKPAGRPKTESIVLAKAERRMGATGVVPSSATVPEELPSAWPSGDTTDERIARIEKMIAELAESRLAETVQQPAESSNALRDEELSPRPEFRDVPPVEEPVPAREAHGHPLSTGQIPPTGDGRVRQLRQLEPVGLNVHDSHASAEPRRGRYRLKPAAGVRSAAAVPGRHVLRGPEGSAASPAEEPAKAASHDAFLPSDRNSAAPAWGNLDDGAGWQRIE